MVEEGEVLYEKWLFEDLFDKHTLIQSDSTGYNRISCYKLEGGVLVRIVKAKRLHTITWDLLYGEDTRKGFQIHHIDGNKHNNYITNLEKLTATGHRNKHKFWENLKGKTYEELYGKEKAETLKQVCTKNCHTPEAIAKRKKTYAKNKKNPGKIRVGIPVICLPTGRIFLSIAEAESWLGTKGILSAMNRGGTCGGKKWIYMETLLKNKK